MKVKATDSPMMGRIWAILAVAMSSYFGYDQYEQATSSTETTVNVNVEGIDAMPAGHAHEIFSREQIAGIITAAIAANNKELSITYKKLETWEK